MSPRLKIGVQVGYTIKIGQEDFSDWARPTVHAELEFDELPSETEIKERWQWLWDKQIGPQSEALLDLLTRELTRRLANFREPSLPADHPRPVPVSDGDVYA